MQLFRPLLFFLEFLLSKCFVDVERTEKKKKNELLILCYSRFIDLLIDSFHEDFDELFCVVLGLRRISLIITLDI